MAFELKTLPQILQAMIAEAKAKSGLNDLNPGSTFVTFLEAAAAEDFRQYYQMLNIINNFSLDKSTGEDLEKRAIEYGLTEGRILETKAFDAVTIGDSSITKVSTKIYAGTAGPVKDQTFLRVDDASAFDPTGNIIVGRGTTNVETVGYSSIDTTNPNFDVITLTAGLLNDHGTDETVIMSQGGDRVITAGTTVRVPATDFADPVLFTTNFEAIIQDGESEVTGVIVTAVEASTSGNVPAGSIVEFDAKPFPTITVSNPAAFTNGTDTETDSELRDRIRQHIQSLSRGTANSIINNVIGIVDGSDNKRVVSANYIDTTTTDGIGRLIIDDGTGLEPGVGGQGLEVLIGDATGGEQFLQIQIFPMIKALVTTINEEPFAIENNMTFVYQVANTSETITFTDSDFRVPGVATAQEVVAAINNKATLIEARTADEATRVEIRAKTQENEDIKVVGGTANDISILNFNTDRVETLVLYKFDGDTLTQLSKDGITASLENQTPGPYNFSITPTHLDVQIDGEVMFSSSAQAGSGLNTLVDIKLGQKFPALSTFFTKKITFTSGANEGVTVNILNYDGLSSITTDGAITISADDEYQIEDIERIYFSNVAQVDFSSPENVTIDDVVRVINDQIRGLAIPSSNGERVSLVSKLEGSSNSKVRVWADSSTANVQLGFPTEEVVGRDRDYALNRFNGQIELVAPLAENEEVTAGTRRTRGFLINSIPQPYTLNDGDSITFIVDEGTPQQVIFDASAFSNSLLTAVSAQEVVDFINDNTVGMTAKVTSDNRIQIRTNTWDTSGSIEVSTVLGTGANLSFTLGSKQDSILSHTAFLVADSEEPYLFVEEDRLVVVLDNDIVTKTFDIRMDLGGTVLEENTPSQVFRANISALGQNFTNKFTNNNDLVGFKIIWKVSNGETVAAPTNNVGQTRFISSYDATGTGQIAMGAALPHPIQVGDEFVIIPMTRQNIVTHLNNTANSTLSLFADVELVNDGTQIQISTKENGSAGLVNVTGSTANAMLNLLTLDGSGNGLFVESALYKEGMEVRVQSEGSFSETEIRVTNVETGVTSNAVNNTVSGAFNIFTDIQGSGSVEITDVRLRADSSDDLNSKAWLLNSAKNITQYYVWYNTPTSVPTDPNIVGRTGIRVDIPTNATANQVATLTAAAIDALDDFSCPAPISDTITITNTAVGATDPVLDYSIFGAFLVTLIQNGVNAVAESWIVQGDDAANINTSEYFTFWSALNAKEFYGWINKGDGLQETTQFTMRSDTSDDLDGTHFLLNSASDKTQYYVWFASNNVVGSVDPAIPSRTGIRVDYDTDDLDTTIAALVQAKLDAIPDFDASVLVNSVVVTNAVAGITTDAADGDVGAPFAVNVTQQGTLGDPIQFTPALAGKTSIEIQIDPTADANLVVTEIAQAIDALEDFSSAVPYRDTVITAVVNDDPSEGVQKLTMAHDVSAYTVNNSSTISRRKTLGFSTVPAQGRDGYKFYTGIMARVQKTVDGLESSQEFPGIKAAGVQIEVQAPTVQKLQFEIDVTLTEGLNISIVVDDLKTAVSNYVNGLGVGEDVILNEIVERIMGVDGIVDVDIIFPSTNIVIADNEIARVSLGDITIG